MECLVEVENGGDNVGGVVWVFEEDLIADCEVADLAGGDVGKDTRLEPFERGVVGVGG